MAWSRVSRHQRGYGTSWDRLRKLILARDNYLCQACLAKGRVTQGNQVDHITPKAKGGTDAADNLQVLCAECNMEKARQESAEARGVNIRPRKRIGLDGWPVEV